MAKCELGKSLWYDLVKNTPATTECRTSDITLAEFKNSGATSCEDDA